MRRYFQDPYIFWLIIIAAALLIVFVVYPLVHVLRLSFTEGGAGSVGNYHEFLFTPSLRRVFYNSLFMAVISTIGAMVVGFSFAYLIIRTDIPGKKIFQITALLPLISPPFVMGLAFILLFGRRGLLTYGLLGTPVDVYGWQGLFFVQILAFYPIAYLVISGSMRSLNPSLEHAAHNLGGGGFHVFRTITLPLLAPVLLGAALLVAISVLADFGNPLLIAGGFSVLATEAYLQVVGMLDMEMAAALSVVLLAPSLTFFYIQHNWLRKKSYITVTGASSYIGIRPTKPWVKWSLFAFCLSVSVVVLLLYATIIIGTFTRVWGVDFSFTLDNLAEAIGWGGALRNSLTLAAGAAIGSAVLGIIIAYLTYRRKFFGRASMDLVSMLPFAIPGTVLGIGFIIAFNVPPLVLTGTPLLIMLVMLFRSMPIGIRAGKAALQQISPSIEEASMNLGASSIQTIRKIVFPLLKSAFTAGFVYTFVKSMTTLSAVIFLVFPGWNLASVVILGLAEHGYWGQGAALSFLLILISATVLLLFRVIGGKKVQLFQL